MNTTSPPSQSIELQQLSNMDRIKNLFRPRPDYEPLQNDRDRDDESVVSDSAESTVEPPFSWIDYSVFFLLGIAMLWAW